MGNEAVETVVLTVDLATVLSKLSTLKVNLEIFFDCSDLLLIFGLDAIGGLGGEISETRLKSRPLEAVEVLTVIMKKEANLTHFVNSKAFSLCAKIKIRS